MKKVKLYYGANDQMELEIPEEVHAINIDGKAIIYIDNIGKNTEINAVIEDADIGVELLRVKAGEAFVKKDRAHLNGCRHITISMKKV